MDFVDHAELNQRVQSLVDVLARDVELVREILTRAAAVLKQLQDSNIDIAEIPIDVVTVDHECFDLFCRAHYTLQFVRPSLVVCRHQIVNRCLYSAKFEVPTESTLGWSMTQETDNPDTNAASFTLAITNQLVLLFGLLAIAANSAGVISNYAMVVTIGLMVILYAAILAANFLHIRSRGTTA